MDACAIGCVEGQGPTQRDHDCARLDASHEGVRDGDTGAQCRPPRKLCVRASGLHRVAVPIMSMQRPLEHTRPAPPEISARAVAVARRLLSPIEAFLRVEASSGAILLAMTAAALAFVNSAWAERYNAVLAMPVGLTFGPVHVEDASLLDQ